MSVAGPDTFPIALNTIIATIASTIKIIKTINILSVYTALAK